MRWQATIPQAVLILAGALLPGCGGPQGGHVRMKCPLFVSHRPAAAQPSVQFLGFAAANDGWKDLSGLGIMVATWTRQQYDTDVLLRIKHTYDSKVQDFLALVGPDPNHPGPAVIEVHGSAANVHIHSSWAMLLGQLPMGETGTTQTSSSGSQILIRREPAASSDPDDSRDTIYHLADPKEPNEPDAWVCVPGASKPIALPRGYYLTYPPAGGPVVVQQIQAPQPFLDYVCQRALNAGVQIAWTCSPGRGGMPPAPPRPPAPPPGR